LVGSKTTIESENKIMKKKVRKIIKQNLYRFAKKTFWRLLGRIVELIVLFAVGYSLGLKLVRY
jgi:hypothetical protein